MTRSRTPLFLPSFSSSEGTPSEKSAHGYDDTPPLSPEDSAYGYDDDTPPSSEDSAWGYDDIPPSSSSEEGDFGYGETPPPLSEDDAFGYDEVPPPSEESSADDVPPLPLEEEGASRQNSPSPEAHQRVGSSTGAPGES